MRSFIILACLQLPNSALADSATGRVFIDSNKNGVLDTAEQGIEGVRVSNGINVVTTDEEGRYILPVDEQSIIFYHQATRPRNSRQCAHASSVLLHSSARGLASRHAL